MTRNHQNKKICIFTGTRAEYGLLYWLMRDIQVSNELELQLIVSGAHLSKQYGETAKQIEEDGFDIDYKVDLNLDAGNQRIDVAHSMGLATSGVAKALNELKPDVFILLGDRYELLGAASAALVMGVPIFHLHGGEITEGAYDDSIRHAITKMASWHGVANEEYRKRVIQMGENPDMVYNVGGLGLDNIKRLKLLLKAELEEQLDFKLGEKNILVTYHPVTNTDKEDKGFDNLLAVLQNKKDINILFTYPNADHGSDELIEKIDCFVKQNSNRSKAWKSLGQLKYLSALQYVDAVVGNSSSGIIEAPSFNIASVNIGNRQKGRLKAISVLDCDENTDSIYDAINQALRPLSKEVINPYGEGGVSKKIIKKLKTKSCDNTLCKVFHNLYVK